MAGEKLKLLALARSLGMSLAALRMLPMSEVRKRVDARQKQIKESTSRIVKK
jgi:hypothetical protein